jgi:hypothetical protein
VSPLELELKATEMVPPEVARFPYVSCRWITIAVGETTPAVKVWLAPAVNTNFEALAAPIVNTVVAEVKPEEAPVRVVEVEATVSL